MAARTLQPGELVVLTIDAGEETTGVHATAFGRDLAAFKGRDGRWRALVGIDVAQLPGPYLIGLDVHGGSGVAHLTRHVSVRRKTFPVRSLEVDPSFVNPPPDAMLRIDADAVLLRGVYASPASERLWTGPFVRPVPGAANSRFGSRSVFNGQARSPHAGADFLSPLGTPIQAPNTGRVVVARDLFFTGNTVVIDHGLGVFSLLAHLSRLDVHEGEMVTAAQQVGLVGATGRVTGPHLHWALRVAGARVDPISALAIVGDW
jgi:murein DD-endopeptidase MepM/ murein hydrolase activator NlpD